MTGSTHPRPGFGVSVVGVLTMISGILNLVAGIILLFTREDINGDFPTLSTGEIALFGVVAIIFGLIYILVGRGMLKMSRLALGLGLVVSAINLVSGVLVIIFEGISNLHYSILVSTLISLLVLLILSRAFGRASEAQQT